MISNKTKKIFEEVFDREIKELDIGFLELTEASDRLIQKAIIEAGNTNEGLGHVIKIILENKNSSKMED